MPVTPTPLHGHLQQGLENNLVQMGFESIMERAQESISKENSREKNDFASTEKVAALWVSFIF